MSDPIGKAKQHLLEPAELSLNQIQSVLSALMTPSISYADLYFQNAYYETWSLEDSQIKGGSFNIDKGVGVRAVSEEKTGFAYTDDMGHLSLLEAAKAARSIVELGQTNAPKIQLTNNTPIIYPMLDPLSTIPTQKKLDLLLLVDKVARKEDKRVIQVNASLSGCYEVVLIANSDGRVNADVRPLVSIHVSVIVDDNGKRESARSGGGGRGSYQMFYDNDMAVKFAKEAVRQALLNLDAQPAPAGLMPVVLGPGWPGVLLHEAVGHGLEADFNRKKLSAFTDLIGQQVAATGVTVVDNGTMQGRRGSLAIDDEGTPTQENILIEDGILRGYMQDTLNARLMNAELTGNCRRESYAHVPLPRMTNTYMLAGEYQPEEIIRSVKKGIYAVNFGGGQVDITSGKFVFSASEAYLIEDGHVTTPVKGATLIGSGPDVMKKISMVGNDLALDEGIGVCGKDGQSVPVGVGQPTLKIDEITVGGTQA